MDRIFACGDENNLVEKERVAQNIIVCSSHAPRSGLANHPVDPVNPGAPGKAWSIL